MIGVCTQCSAMFETTEEDACTPGVLCVECYKAEREEAREGPTLGPCCVCERAGATVRSIIMLDKLSPIPGHGWGCVVCHLPSDGASAVVCDECLDAHPEGLTAHLKFACRGYPGSEGRVPYAELQGEFGHNMELHEETEQ